MWGTTNTGKKGKEQGLRKLRTDVATPSKTTGLYTHRGNLATHSQGLFSSPSHKHKRKNPNTNFSSSHSVISGATFGTGLSSGGGGVGGIRPRIRDFQSSSNVLFSGWGNFMGMGSDNSKPSSGFQWSKYNGEDDAKRELMRQIKKQNEEQLKTKMKQQQQLQQQQQQLDIYGRNNHLRQPHLLQSTSNNNTQHINDQLLDDDDEETASSSLSSYTPTLQGALTKIIRGLHKLLRSKLKKSKYASRSILLGIGMAFLLASFFSERASGSYKHFYNNGGILMSMIHVPRILFNFGVDILVGYIPIVSSVIGSTGILPTVGEESSEYYGPRPDFVYEHPYVSSSYYTSTSSMKTLYATDMLQVQPKLLVGRDQQSGSRSEDQIKTRLAIVRPFCEFDAEALPTTFACWNALPPCKAAQEDIGEDDEDGNEFELGPNGEFVAYRNNTAGRKLYDSFGEHHYFDQVGSDAMKSATADVFLFYSQTFSENDVAIKAVDTIIDQFFEPGGWSQCFDNIYAIEANIPQELDLYIPSAQEELYNWVNGPNRQFEAAFRIIQSGEWGDYDGFYLMEGDSVPIKAHWLDVVLSEIEVNRPFAILGAQYDGDKWDNFYEKIPISLLHHTNGNAIYNTSHPLLERLVGQLEVEAPCPYNSIPYDYRMSQMWVEGTLGIVPKLAPKIMLNEEGENITLSNNTNMFLKWAEIWEEEDPFKYTPVIHNYAATNLIPRHLGPEYIIHGAKLYSPWDPTKTEVTLVVSEWFFDRSLHLIKNLDDKDHPFSEVVVMVPPAAAAHDDYDLMTEVPIRTQHRGGPDFMDLCEAEVKTDWFMITNSYHHVARHVDLMFTPGTFKPVIPFTPATYAFCFKYPYCKETVNLAQRFNPGHDKVVQDMDMLYNTEMRDAFCKEWKEQNGEEGEDMYKNHQRRLAFRKKIIGPPGPTGTAYYAWLVHQGKDGMYKLTDRSLYGARPPFVKIFAKEEKLDGMSEDELAKRVGMTLMDNSTDCNCMEFQTESDCEESEMGCIWRPLFETCHPPELIDGSAPICPQTEAPTTAPTVSIEGLFDETLSPTMAPVEPEPEEDVWYVSMFKSREHEEQYSSETDSLVSPDNLEMMDDDAIPPLARKLKDNRDIGYPVDLSSPVKKFDDARPRNMTNPEKIESSRESDYTTPVTKIDDDSVGGNVVDALSIDAGATESAAPRKLATEFTNGEYDHGIFADSLGDSEDGLRTERCDSWGPSVVPRDPIEMSEQNRTKILAQISLTFASSESRPRRLLSNELPTILSSLQALPLNLKKYEMKNSLSDEIQNVGLATPVANNAGQLPSTYRTILNYGDKHPFEGAIYEAGVFQPLRINFDTEQVTANSKTSFKTDAEENDYNGRVSAINDEILPRVSRIWSEALSVVPVVGNMFLNSVNGACGDADVPQSYSTTGVPDTDTLIFVTKDGPFCQVGTASYASVCSFDQHMRPISGNLVICLNDIEVNDGIVSKQEILRQISMHTLEVGKMLGLSPALFQHYRNPTTGRAWGTSARTVTCVDGIVDTLEVPNILEQGFYDDDEFSDDGADGAFFQVISPTVKQVIRNHFDCQTLRGARLENNANSVSCFGETFDDRFHFDDDMASISQTADKAFTISPLSLALLEDSSWYKADFSKATTPVFGRGAGCGFVKGRCLIDGTVPNYGKGVFCDKIHQTGCDYTHSHKALCDIDQLASPSQEDQCPMRTRDIVTCSDESNEAAFDFESFGPNSRCFETTHSDAACIKSFCNTADGRLDLIVGDDIFQCDYEGQLITIQDHKVRCPRLAVVCPDLVCPANCSGKGMCDYCQEMPQCICDDPFDETPGCWGDSF